MVTLLVLIAFVVVTIAASVAMAVAAGPAADSLVGYTILNSIYLAVEADASTGLVYASVGGAMAFMVLAQVSILVGAILFIGKLQKVLRARYVGQVPLAAHRRFFTWGVASLAWCICLPVLFILGAEWGTDLWLDSLNMEEMSWGTLWRRAPWSLWAGSSWSTGSLGACVPSASCSSSP